MVCQLTITKLRDNFLKNKRKIENNLSEDRRKQHIQYINFIHENNEQQKMYSGPVANSDVAYLRKATTHFRLLSDDDYMTGPACILHILAKYSYVLDDQCLYWCIEWPPGILIVRISANHTLEWVALRSPVPNFGGRTPLPEDGDPDEYDEDDPQYNLIFTPWDAQFDQQHREWDDFAPADTEVQSRFENALSHVNALAAIMEARYADNWSDWFARCKQNIEQFSGEGVRLKLAD